MIGHQSLTRESPSPRLETYKYVVENRLSIMANATEHYFYLSSEDCSSYFPLNEPNRFISKLNRDYNLRGVWECAVTEVQFVANFTRPVDRFIYLCCDIVRPSYVYCTKKNILRRLDIEGLDLNKSKFSKEFNPYFVELNGYQFSEITINLLDSNLKQSSLVAPFSCVLHMRRKY